MVFIAPSFWEFVVDLTLCLRIGYRPNVTGSQPCFLSELKFWVLYIYIYVHIYTYVYMIYVCSVCIFIYIHSFKMLYTYLFHYIPFSFLNISNQHRSHLWLWDNLQQPPIFFSKNLQDLRGRSYERSSIALLADYFWDYTLYYPIDFSDHRYP